MINIDELTANLPTFVTVTRSNNMRQTIFSVNLRCQTSVSDSALCEAVDTNILIHTLLQRMVYQLDDKLNELREAAL
jgi:hypothetical protein